MKRVLQTVLISLALGFLAQGGFSIVIRDDRSDELYRALGAKYPQSGYFRERVGCTLIAPRWAVTAAHVVEENPAFINYYVLFGGKRYEVEKIIVHPARVKGTVDSSADLALLKLKEPAADIEPALLYDRSDEPGKKIILVGRGKTGTGLTGDIGDRGVLRGATNEIDGTLENSLIATFDPPPYGTDLEGMGGAGDSGSPAFYEENGKLYLIGVDSFASGSSKQGTSGKYLTFTGYARISTRRQWILNTVKADPPDSLWGTVRKIKNGQFPKDIFGRRAEAFFKAFNSGTESGIADFYAGHRPPSKEGKTPAERAKGWQEDMDRDGKYEVYGLSSYGKYSYAFLVYSSGQKIWRGVQLDFEQKAPFRVKSMQFWDTQAPTN